MKKKHKKIDKLFSNLDNGLTELAPYVILFSVAYLIIDSLRERTFREVWQKMVIELRWKDICEYRYEITDQIIGEQLEEENEKKNKM